MKSYWCGSVVCIQVRFQSLGNLANIFQSPYLKFTLTLLCSYVILACWTSSPLQCLTMRPGSLFHFHFLSIPLSLNGVMWHRDSRLNNIADFICLEKFGIVIMTNKVTSFQEISIIKDDIVGRNRVHSSMVQCGQLATLTCSVYFNGELRESNNDRQVVLVVVNLSIWKFLPTT